jgi:hypothetical protein
MTILLSVILVALLVGIIAPEIPWSRTRSSFTELLEDLHIIKAQKRYAATQILEDLRQIDSAIDQYAIANGDLHIHHWKSDLRYVPGDQRADATPVGVPDRH